MKKTIFLLATTLVFAACGGDKPKTSEVEEVVEEFEASEYSAEDDWMDEMGGYEELEKSSKGPKPVEASEEDLEYNEDVAEAEDWLEAAEDASYEEDVEEESELKTAAKGAYERGKEKLKEKKQGIEESETYQNAKEKASELKESAKEKATEVLDDMFR